MKARKSYLVVLAGLVIVGLADFRAVLRISHPYELALIGAHVNVSLIVQLRLLGVLGLLFLESASR